LEALEEEEEGEIVKKKKLVGKKGPMGISEESYRDPIGILGPQNPQIDRRILDSFMSHFEWRHRGASCQGFPMWDRDPVDNSRIWKNPNKSKVIGGGRGRIAQIIP